MAKKPTKLWDNCKPIGEVMKSERTKLKVELVARDGVKYLNVREWYLKKSEGVWKPGLAGLAIPLAIPVDGTMLLPASHLVELIGIASSEAASFAIADEANEVWVYPKE